MQLEGLDALGAFDFSSIFTSVGNVLQKQAPVLVKAAVDQRIAKLQAKQQAVSQPAASASVSVPTLQPSAPLVPTRKSQGIDKRLLIGGSVGIAALLIFLMMRG